MSADRRGADDELDRLLRASRPDITADDGWAESVAGIDALAAIRSAADHGYRTRGLRIRLPRPASGAVLRRPALVGLGVATVAAVLVGVSFGVPAGDHPGGVAGSRPGPGTQFSGPRPAELALAGYDTCAAAVAGLRDHAADYIANHGLPVQGYLRNGAASIERMAPMKGDLGNLAAASAPSATSSPAHSGTNDQVAGADEPDTLKTDGKRIVTVSDSSLRVTDVASHALTGTLDLSAYTGGGSAQILLSGNRVLVLLSDPASSTSMVDLPVGPGRYPGSYQPTATNAVTVLLVDISKPEPHLVSMFRPTGQLIDARLVNGTARLVVRNAAALPTLPEGPTGSTRSSRRTFYDHKLATAPLADWLPAWSVTTGGTTAKRTLECADLSHPVTYTGLSTVTVYTVDPSAGFGDVAPVAIASDTGQIYASTSSLYIASDGRPGSPKQVTQVHRFDIEGSGRPVYLGSGSVPGSVDDSYSMSEWNGSLRILTTTSGRYYATSDTRHQLYVLDAARLTVRGTIADIGDGEQLHAVRFLDGLGYVVTFRQIDPLFVLDLRDAYHPKIAGSLTVSGYSGYLHDVGDGRLLGVGEATADRPGADGAVPTGLQVSLIDVASPAHPKQAATVVRNEAVGDGDIDPHAFLYWAAKDLAVVPLASYGRSGGKVLVVKVGHDSLTTLGTVSNPAGSTSPDDANGPGIQRTLVIGDSLWTFSSSGLLASDLTTLERQAFVSFS